MLGGGGVLYPFLYKDISDVKSLYKTNTVPETNLLNSAVRNYVIDVVLAIGY